MACGRLSGYFFARAMPGCGDSAFAAIRPSTFLSLRTASTTWTCARSCLLARWSFFFTAGVILPVYRMVPSSSLMARCHGMDFGVDVGVGNSFDTALACVFDYPGGGGELLG